MEPLMDYRFRMEIDGWNNLPVATVGGPDSMPVLATGRRLAKLLALDRVARLKTFPIAIQAGMDALARRRRFPLLG